MPVRRKMERLAREFDLLNREDSGKPFEQRRGYTAVIALRDWRYKGLRPCARNAANPSARSPGLITTAGSPATGGGECRSFACGC